ncbi:lactate racemase domain-containing protein [Sporomusa termitida]|uniref:LarA-like N-terminal domain-containing protein n=1 Tax=Sporomusa termitida TaxID=2377 RepID=A0A517E1B3_9FIRM|nr:lactate racemase domain-containing protein [Sporomusa termitida]QDR83394.1 hypothetical protein SPTER_48850 [Sporomusa termitida]
MAVINDLLQSVRLPPMIRVKQCFPAAAIDNVPAALRAQLRQPDIAGRVKQDMRVAIAVGSRGMAEIPRIVKVVVEELQRRGARPFIVPAMGSHGGATAAGQKQLLASLGVTESSAGCPIVASMEVVALGELNNGLPVLMDQAAATADGIVVINRVKAHSAFSGTNESGLVKMLAIGLGKQKGAAACHALGFEHMARFIVQIARVGLQRSPVLFGIATVENAYDRLAKLVAIPAESIIETEQELLAEAKANMPKLFLQPVDVLIVDQMGKEFSGSGMDPHITGRASTSCLHVGPGPNKLIVLDVSSASHGNAVGMGMADITTRRLFSKIDFDATYTNVLTSTTLQAARIPVIMESDRMAILAGVKTCNKLDPAAVRMVRIGNTLRLEDIFISQSMLAEALAHPCLAIAGRPETMVFDDAGNLTDIGCW